MSKPGLLGLMIFAGSTACGVPLASDVPADAAVQDGGGALADAGLSDRLDAGDPFADEVVRFTPGAGAGFGQSAMPGVVLGPPHGAGANAGSTDVVSLGREGVIELAFTDFDAIDGPGVDLVVFENPFIGFIETGVVAVSADGVEWHEFPCGADGGTFGCAGVAPVYSNPENGLSPLDPLVGGGDAFDLHDVGVARARFVRIRDSGLNRFYGAPTGGFDLDAVAVVNAARH